MFQFANRARVIAGVGPIAALLCVATASAGGAPMVWSTLYSSEFAYTYSGIGQGIPESGSVSFSFTGPSNSTGNTNLYTFGTTSQGTMGWELAWQENEDYTYGVDLIRASAYHNQPAFAALSSQTSATFDIGFSSASGSVTIVEPLTNATGTWLVVNALGQQQSYSSIDGLSLANGRYNISWIGNTTTFPFAGQQVAFSVTSEAVPAPGAIALLGLAGLAGRRRR